MGSTLGACGDVNRNVCAPPAPYTNRPEYLAAEKVRRPLARPPTQHRLGESLFSPECGCKHPQAAEDIADLLAPQSGAYYDVWLDGEKFMSSVMEVRTKCRVLGHTP